MIGGRTGERHAGRALGAALGDLVPSAVLVVVTAAVDTAVVHAHGTLAPGGAFSDAGLGMSVASGLAVLGVPGTVRRGLVRRAGIREIDAMTGGEFEERLAALYRIMGYTVRHTGRRGDFGADLVIERGVDRTVVQAKRYHGAVGIEAVQQVVGAARYYDAAGAAVVTNSRFTPAARALAAANGVDLVERESLVRLLATHTEGGRGLAAARVFVCQLAEGVRLCAYTAGAVVRLAWRLLHVLGRGARAPRRSTG